jgi:hypothetical protein
MRKPNSNFKFSANTVHLATTALAWKAPEILRILVGTAIGGSVGLLGLVLAVPLLAESPAFSEKTRKAQEFYDVCYAKIQIEHPGASGIRRHCQSQATLYKQSL